MRSSLNDLRCCFSWSINNGQEGGMVTALEEINMKTVALLFVLSALPLLSSVAGVQGGFDFFYFVLQWPQSFCDTERCCYPTSGKPEAEFLIHGLWPNNNDGSYPSNCDPGNSFDASQISDLRSSLNANWPSLACRSSNTNLFWAHEWDKHGTCAESVFNEHGYFQAALNLKSQVDILKMLSSSGIEPNDNTYSLRSIEDTIQRGVGYKAGIQCNRDRSGNSQLYQVLLCVDSSGTNLFECPHLPSETRCAPEVKFPSF